MTGTLRVIAIVLTAIDAGLLLGVVRHWWRCAGPHARAFYRWHVSAFVLFVEMELFLNAAYTLSRIGHRFVWYGTPFVLCSVVVLPIGLAAVVAMARRHEERNNGHEQRRLFDDPPESSI